MPVTTETVAGGSADFMAVRHVSASGSQTDIGRALALEAQRTYGWTPAPADPLKARARRAWFARHWPQHLARMQGAAEALGLDPDTDEVYLDGAGGIPLGSACSSSYYPNCRVLGRNYDFFTTSVTELFAMLAGQDAGPTDEMPISARPYVITSVPDDGPATSVLTMNELDGCMEGINEHGLAAVLNLADAENVSGPVDAGPQVGVSSGQLLRFVLDTCSTVEEAKAALLDAKQYDHGVALHYLVADPSGAAFVWERGPGGDEHIVEADGGALCMTNHPLHRHRDRAALPEDTDETMLTYQRFRTLSERSAGSGLSAARMREALDAVRVDAATDTPYPVRTLWRTVLDLERRTMATHFYLGDAPDGAPRYSPELEFPAPALQPA